nr:MAG TPA: hypothetical protein [Caudoviricetes sp.]
MKTWFFRCFLEVKKELKSEIAFLSSEKMVANS